MRKYYSVQFLLQCHAIEGEKQFLNVHNLVFFFLASLKEEK
jgi:hypothetical protein